MKNVTLAMDEKLLEAGRNYARQHHTSLNALLRKLLEQAVGSGSARTGLDEFLRLARQAKADFGGWKWNRADIYDRKVFR